MLTHQTVNKKSKRTFKLVFRDEFSWKSAITRGKASQSFTHNGRVQDFPGNRIHENYRKSTYNDNKDSQSI
jgi:hypothetical protein